MISMIRLIDMILKTYDQANHINQKNHGSDNLQYLSLLFVFL
jgi:hypothetical protein